MNGSLGKAVQVGLKAALLVAGAGVAAAVAVGASAQTTSGSSATVVVPVIAQTSSFGSEVTVYNPNAGTITVNVSFYDAQNTGSPGSKPCSSLSVAAGRSTQFALSGQCTLPSGSNFGLLVLSEQTGTQRFYGYARTQNPQGIGFSTEGFPIENFNDQVQYATGLKRTAGGGGLPPYQTNCFVGTLGDAVNYQLALYDGTTGAQIGSTLSGSLQPWQQYRYLSILTAVGAPGGDVSNVRAQFTNLTGAGKKLIGFCTVQDNASFGADFRIAKSYGGTPQNAFVQGGNAFGTTALLGTTDNQPFTLLVNNQPTLRIAAVTNIDNASTVNVINGSPLNVVDAGVVGATIAGGGGNSSGYLYPNRVTGIYGTVGGGMGNLVGGTIATVTGGSLNTATGYSATVAGGIGNTASGFKTTVAGGSDNNASNAYATVAGGYGNTASGNYAMVAGGYANTASGSGSFAGGEFAYADQSGCAVFGLWSTATPMSCLGSANIFRIGADNGFSVDYNTQRVDGGGTRWLAIGSIAGQTIGTWTGAFLTDTGVWTNASDRALKTDFHSVDSAQILQKVVKLPITRWTYKVDRGQQHLGPVAQDFYAAFGLGADDKHIGTVDEAGVALAAIQGLYQLVLQKDARIEQGERKLDAARRAIAEQRLVLDAAQRQLRVLQQRVAGLDRIQDEVRALKASFARLATQRSIDVAGAVDAAWRMAEVVPSK